MNENLELSMCDVVARANVEACLIMTPLKLTDGWQMVSMILQ